MAGDAAEGRFSTVDTFVAWEEAQAERFEFIAGTVWPAFPAPQGMAGGSVLHNELVFNLRGALSPLFRPRGCRVLSENVRLKTASLSVYPDVLVVCAPVGEGDAFVSEASLVAEVLSDGTEKKDRTVKQQAYLAAPFLKQLLLVSQDERTVEVYTRMPAGWIYASQRDPDGAIDLPALDARLAMADVYRGTAVPAAVTVVPFGKPADV